jgi:hypothetical protein
MDDIKNGSSMTSSISGLCGQWICETMKLCMYVRSVTGRHGLGRSGAGCGQVAGGCECDNEPLGNVKCGEYHSALLSISAYS